VPEINPDLDTINIIIQEAAIIDQNCVSTRNTQPLDRCDTAVMEQTVLVPVQYINRDR
jgi:hypothetical protein